MVDLELLNRITDKIYIADMKTNEIVYANPSLLHILGYSELSQVKGRKCYEILQGKKSPCGFCTNHCIKEHEFLEWTTYNSLLGKTFLNQDTVVEWDGRRCRLEICSEQEKLDEADAFYEKLGNEVLGTALKEDDINEGIFKAIGLLGEKMNADRIYIFEIQGDFCNNTYEWCAEGVSSEIANLQNIQNEIMSPWYDAFSSIGEVCIENLEDEKEEHPDIYEYLKPQNIHTLVAQPIYVRKKMVGFFGVDNVEPERIGNFSQFMKTMAAYVSDLVEKRDNRRNLEHLGKYDSLTSLYNRKEAESRINESLQDHEGTLLIIDLDCFKHVNDLFGHQRGDTLLQEVGSRMEQVCSAEDIAFRLGGDEFGVFFSGVTEDEVIADKCEALLKLLDIVVEEGEKRVEVSASIGVAEAHTKGMRFAELYVNADKNLYKAKDNGKNRYCLYDK